MALSNFGELKASVASWLNRTDLTSQIPDFVSLAEVDIRNDVRVQAMEQYASGALTGESLDHPARYLSARRLTIGGVVYRYVAPEVYAAAVEAGSSQAIYTAIGQVFYILGASDGDEYTLIYYAAFAPLSSDSDTNWLLTNHADVYLYGACAAAGVFLADDATQARFTALYQNAVGRLVSRERQSAVSGSALVMRSATSE